MNAPTLGAYRVGTSFNPSANPTVDEIKSIAALLIDLIAKIDEPEYPATDVGHHAVSAYNEVVRCKSLAMTKVEEAAMWAVKSATKSNPV